MKKSTWVSWVGGPKRYLSNLKEAFEARLNPIPTLSFLRFKKESWHILAIKRHGFPDGNGNIYWADRIIGTPHHTVEMYGGFPFNFIFQELSIDVATFLFPHKDRVLLYLDNAVPRRKLRYIKYH